MRGLLQTGDTGPKRVERCQKRVIAPAPVREVVIEIKPGALVPHELVYQLGARGRPLLPLLRFPAPAQFGLNCRHVVFHDVKQRVQTNRVVMNDVDVERPEAVRRIETRFPHRAVTFIKQRGQPVVRAVVILIHVIVRHLMRAVVFANQIVVRPAILIALGGNYLGRRTLAGIVISRKPGLRREMRGEVQYP